MSGEYGFRVVDASRSIRRVAADLRRAVARVIERDEAPQTDDEAEAAVEAPAALAGPRDSGGGGQSCGEKGRGGAALKLAAIDIGSNSIKLVVVEAAGSDSFAVLAREKEVVRLGQDTLRQGYLAPAAIERACDTMKRFRSIAEARGAERVLATATASVREASNAAEFIEEVERRAGVRVEILSGIEEARLIGIAAAHGCARTQGAALVNVDIGGGSTEISLMKDGVPVELYSLKLGAVGLTERHVTSDPPAAERTARAARPDTRRARTTGEGTDGRALAVRDRNLRHHHRGRRGLAPPRAARGGDRPSRARRRRAPRSRWVNWKS